MIQKHIFRLGVKGHCCTGAMVYLLLAGFPSTGGAFVVNLPQPSQDLELVAQLSNAGASAETATYARTLNFVCQAANLPHAPLPDSANAAGGFLNPADAKNTVDVLKQVSKTKRQVCSQSEPAPSSVLNLVGAVVDQNKPVDPHPHHGPIASDVPAPTREIIQNVHNRLNANR